MWIKRLRFFADVIVDTYMENMDKGLTVPKWELVVRLKIPQMPQKISVQNVCPSPNF